ncbi:hypothetical protein AWC02_00030 [Mycolicibacter engbaekii]|uniref:Uncharacterized protein n=1 Tax=Mycolicibacter engbaekii TaxID=188915 RepID=A0A1X1UD12_9MYCO|nr:hypothetical protein AWC02_00030 [Mycolicibacter engbaekii]
MLVIGQGLAILIEFFSIGCRGEPQSVSRTSIQHLAVLRRPRSVTLVHDQHQWLTRLGQCRQFQRRSINDSDNRSVFLKRRSTTTTEQTYFFRPQGRVSDEHFPPLTRERLGRHNHCEAKTAL